MISKFKILFFISFNLCFQICLAEESIKNFQDQTAFNLTQETTVKNKGFSITVPTGWSYKNIGSNNVDLKVDIDSKIIRKSSGEIILTPNKNIETSGIYIAIRDAIPNGFNVNKIYQNNKSKDAKISTELWGGKKWQLVEYKTTKLDKKINSLQWFATTHLKNKDVFILAAISPISEDSNYRTIIKSIMTSAKTQE